MRDTMVARELSTTAAETEPFLSVPQRRSTSLSRSALATVGVVSVTMVGYRAMCVTSMIAYNATADRTSTAALRAASARFRIDAFSAAAYSLRGFEATSTCFEPRGLIPVETFPQSSITSAK
jgi:hypothetical protein